MEGEQIAICMVVVFTQYNVNHQFYYVFFLYLD